jgi:hypothetical protein
MWWLVFGAVSRGGMGGLVGHDFPEGLVADEGPRAQLDAPRAAYQASESLAEPSVRHHVDAAERAPLPQRSEPPQDSLDPAGVDGP